MHGGPFRIQLGGSEEAERAAKEAERAAKEAALARVAEHEAALHRAGGR